jgi:hypothetical protein
MSMSTKCQKNEKKNTINVIQYDDRLRYLRLFYNGAFSIASKNDLDDQNLLLATVHQTCVFSQSGACFHPIKNVYRDKNVLLLCHL